MARLFAHWQRHGHAIELPEQYWQECHTLPQRRGPIQMLKQLLRSYNIDPTGPFRWTVAGTTYNVDTAPDFRGSMIRQVRNTLCGRLHRQEHYRGLASGRNGHVTNSLKQYLDPPQVAFLTSSRQTPSTPRGAPTTAGAKRRQDTAPCATPQLRNGPAMSITVPTSTAGPTWRNTTQTVCDTRVASQQTTAPRHRARRCKNRTHSGSRRRTLPPSS